ncbi:acetolactate decarboxylase [Robiginitalea sp.]|nr:acetolactate decarboxylase [Robiginitalea sp.]
MKLNLFLLALTLLLELGGCAEPEVASNIKVAGKMRDVMWLGQLQGKLSTDTITHHNTYGLGPMSNLKGEILVLEGKTYIAQVLDSGTLRTREVQRAEAPFFVYSTDSDFQNVELSNSSYALESLEQFIDEAYAAYKQPLLVRIDGVFDSLKLHAVNLPEGAKVASPQEAHEGLTTFEYSGLQGTLIGFFSRTHQAVFTHHDSYFHGHFISADRTVLGHVDELGFEANRIKLQVSK